MVLIDWAMAYRYSVLAELIAHPGVLAALGALGFAEPKFGHGRIISKPPQSPPLFWHEDGRFWDDPVSYTWQPIQCFLMYYLTDTDVRNGCLRVIPGSHRKRHALHDETAPMHTDELRTYANPEDAAFQRAEGEIDVPVKAGDVVMGYGRLFHASHANRSDERRTVLTMWYYPHFVDLPERTQATIYSLEARNGETGTRRGERVAGADGAAADRVRGQRRADSDAVDAGAGAEVGEAGWGASRRQVRSCPWPSCLRRAFSGRRRGLLRLLWRVRSSR